MVAAEPPVETVLAVEHDVVAQPLARVRPRWRPRGAGWRVLASSCARWRGAHLAAAANVAAVAAMGGSVISLARPAAVVLPSPKAQVCVLFGWIVIVFFVFASSAMLRRAATTVLTPKSPALAVAPSEKKNQQLRSRTRRKQASWQ